MKYFYIFLIIFISSCKFSTVRENNDADRKDAEKVVADFYNLLSQKKTDSAIQLFHPNLLAGNDPAKLKDFLNNISAQSPVLKDRILDHWDTRIVKGLDAGSSYSLYYINHYEGNHIFKVSIKLTKDQDDKIKITGFQVDPDKFL